MSVRKRTWTTSKGIEREAWVVDYTDQRGDRILKTFQRKKDADAYASTTHVEVREGTHVADSASVTVMQAGDLWIASGESADPPLERTTLDQYRQHLRLHIEPFIGREKLSMVTVPFVRAFEDRLHAEGCSGTMVRYVVRSLGALLADAQERGLIVRNPVSELKGNRRARKKAGREKRGKALEVGVDIPTPDEIKAIVNTMKGRFRPLLLTAIFTGLRASELRGLRWQDLDLKAGKLHVCQRADRFNRIGPPKTKAAGRIVPLPPMLVNELREWKLKCPRAGTLGLAFPNSEGNVEWHTNIILRGLIPALLAAGVTKPVMDEGKPVRGDDGKSVVEAKYTGLHALRHFYASWCASIGLSMKVVQTRMGHSNIAVTMDTYTKLFPDSDDPDKLAEAERVLLA
jgi:integrase